MRRGLYAFHGDADAFRIISETYDEHEKCRLKDIRMFSTVQLALTVRKGSPYKEHIRQRQVDCCNAVPVPRLGTNTDM
jgi:hypothetical protein